VLTGIYKNKEARRLTTTAPGLGGKMDWKDADKTSRVGQPRKGEPVTSHRKENKRNESHGKKVKNYPHVAIM